MIQEIRALLLDLRVLLGLPAVLHKHCEHTTDALLSALAAAGQGVKVVDGPGAELLWQQHGL